jgi:hypothetical protein
MFTHRFAQIEWFTTPPMHPCLSSDIPWSKQLPSLPVLLSSHKLIRYGKARKGNRPNWQIIYDRDEIETFLKNYQVTASSAKLTRITDGVPITKIAERLHTTVERVRASIDISKQQIVNTGNCFHPTMVVYDRGYVNQFIKEFRNTKSISGHLKAFFDCPLLCHVYNKHHPFNFNDFQIGRERNYV